MNIKERILIFGGSGLIGSYFIRVYSQIYNIISPSHSEVDVTNYESIKDCIDEVKPHKIIYMAGMAKLDEAEDNPELALISNYKAVEFITNQTKKYGTTVLYISSNAVFNGNKSDSPYTEKDIPDPISIYGTSKLLGEKITLTSSSNNSVLRLIIVYSAIYKRKLDFARIVLKALMNNQKLYAFTDQIINPLYVEDAVRAINTVLEKGAVGIYHLGAKDHCSNYEFAKKIAIKFKFNKELIIPCTVNEYYIGRSAKRMKYGWLDVEKFTSKFGNNILHSVDDSIDLFKKKFTT